MIDPPDPDSSNWLAMIWAYLPGAAVLAGAWYALARFISQPDRNAQDLSRQQQEHERRISAIEKEQDRLHSELMKQVSEIRQMLWEVIIRERAHEASALNRKKEGNHDGLD